MRAIILAAGYGNRMRPVTDTVHKTMLRVGDRTILEHIVDALLANQVTKILLVTGYRADDLRACIAARYPELDVQFVHNARYRETNNIVSTALAFEHVPPDEDVLLIESDLVCDPEILRRIIACPEPDVALLDRYRTGMDGTVVTVEEGIVTSVIPPHLQTGEFTFRDKYKTLNIYKFSREFIGSAFRELLSWYCRTIDQSVYYELILGVLIYMKRARIHALVLDGERWAELDDPNDLRAAEFTFNKGARREILESTKGGFWSFDVLDFAYIRNVHFPTPAILSELRSNLPVLIQNYGSAQPVLDRKLAYLLLADERRVRALSGLSQLYPFLRARYEGRRVLVPTPTFGEYDRAFPNARRYEDAPAQGRPVTIASLTEAMTDEEVVVVVNPNNPTGTVLPTDELFALARRRPDRQFIVDESFLDFSDETSLQSRLEREPLENLLLVKSLSKCLGIPGLRLGYAYSCDPSLIADIGAFLPIWSLNSVVEHFLEIVLKHRTSLAESFARTRRDRLDLATRLTAAGHTAHPSGANFLLATLERPRSHADALTASLIERERIYVKDVSDRIGDGRSHLRIAVRLPEEHARLLAAMSAFERESGAQ